MHMEKGHGTKAALEKSFTVINNELRSFQSSYFCGSTGTVVVLDGRHITSAGCGDSPAFLVSTLGKATPLTIDHNPNTHEEERLRVISAGGRVQNMKWGEKNKRVLSFDNLSGLAMTRAFGDFNFPGVIANPHVIEQEIQDDSLFLVVASDGLTEQWTIKGAAEDCLELHMAGLNPREIAEQLTQKAVDQGSRDNISIIILNIQRFLTTDLFDEPASNNSRADDNDEDEDSENGSLGLALSMY
jgi:protein phosphatase 1L